MTADSRQWNTAYVKNFSKWSIVLKKIFPFLKLDEMSRLFRKSVLLEKETRPTVFFYGTGEFQLENLTIDQES